MNPLAIPHRPAINPRRPDVHDLNPATVDRIDPGGAPPAPYDHTLYRHVPSIAPGAPSKDRTIKERTSERDAARQQRDSLQDDLQAAHDRNDFLHRVISAVEHDRDRLRERSEAEIAAARIDLDALTPWLRHAVGHPGAIAGVRRGPSWGPGDEGYAEEQESHLDWIVRALQRVLAAAGRPHCEKCSQVIRVDDAYEPPLPGIGLWEHVGDCPTPPAAPPIPAAQQQA